MLLHQQSLERFETSGVALSQLPYEKCEPIKLYHLTQGRNAWHNTWRQSYFDKSSFHLELSEAQEAAEPFRVQGSTWTIVELPACSFISQRHSLLITEINTKRPLATFCEDIESVCGDSLLSLAQAFRPTKPDSVVRLVSEVIEFSQLGEKLHYFKSESHGGSSPLSWRELDPERFSRKIELCFVVRLCKEFSERARRLSKNSPSKFISPCHQMACGFHA